MLSASKDRQDDWILLGFVLPKAQQQQQQAQDAKPKKVDKALGYTDPR